MKPRICHTCPSAKKENLTFECLRAAQTGNVPAIITFLDNGGDINSSDANGQTMLFSACANGHHQVVSELLKRPDLHLNILFNGVTSIFAATSNGHHECVRLLIESTNKCHANLRIRCVVKEVNFPISPIGIAAVRQHWKSFNILKQTDIFIFDEFPAILSAAVDSKEWDIVREILKPEIGYQSHVFQKIISRAYLRQLDDIVHLVFQRSMHNDGNRNMLVFLLEVFMAKDWENLEALLKILDPTIKFDVSIAEALVKKQYKEVSHMLETKNYDSGSMNGIILIASLGGCSDEIADTLMSDVSRYSEDALKYALLCVSLYDHMYFLPKLLREKKFTYSILFVALNVAKAQRMRNSKMMLNLALAEKNCELFPKFAESGNGMKNVGSNGDYRELINLPFIHFP